MLFSGRHKSGQLDLEAVEMAVRAAVHQAGAAPLSELLQFPEPSADQRNLPRSCGHQSHYRGLHSKPVLTCASGSIGKDGERQPKRKRHLKERPRYAGTGRGRALGRKSHGRRSK